MQHERLVAVFGRGVLDDPDEPAVHADDLGLTRGDGCFEATRLVVADDGSGRADHLDAHVARMERSAAALHIPFDEGAWRELLAEVIDAWGRPGEATLRWVLSRGCEAAPADPVTGVVTVTPIPERTLAERLGVHVATLPIGRPARAMSEAPWLLGGVKTLSYAVNMAAAREARRRGVDDVVFTSTEGLALEAPRAALIWRCGDALATTCHDGTGVLASITQAAVFAGAEAAGVDTSYGLIAVDDLRTVDGAWLVSSGRLTAPILTLDGHELTCDDTWTARLRDWCER